MSKGVLMSWKEFEETVYLLRSKLSPYSDVKFNYKVIGKTTGRSRQIDCAIIENIGGIEIFIALECKELSRPVDIDKVEASVTKLADVQASKGVIVSNMGFTSSARNTAERYSIELHTLKEVEVNEAINITFPIMVKDMYSYSFIIDKIPSEIMKAVNYEDSALEYYIDKKTILVDWEKFIFEHWDCGSLPAEVGINKSITKRVYLKHNNKYYDVDVIIQYGVQVKFYRRKIEINKYLEYVNVLKNKIIIREEDFRPIYNSPVLDSTYEKVNFDDLTGDEINRLIEVRLKRAVLDK